MTCVRRLTIALVMALLTGLTAQSGLAETRFLRDAPDLPLAPGLNEAREQALIYDKPGGRIVESFATGAVNPDLVLVFYRKTLPQLGWQRTGPGLYLREGEKLQIATSTEGDQVTVRFFLSPD